jgi:hypothetical protein
MEYLTDSYVEFEKTSILCFEASQSVKEVKEI